MRIAWVALLVGCTSQGPSVITNAVWVDPIEEEVKLDWWQEADCPAWEQGPCYSPVAFTIDSITCDGCQVRGGDRDLPDYAHPFAPDGTTYEGDAYLFGLPTGGGPITITAVLRDTRGATETVEARAIGDRVIGLEADCWIQPGGVGVQLPCGATRTALDRIYIAPTASTGDHGSFRLSSDVNEDPFNPGSRLLYGGHYTSRPDVTPASFTWSDITTTTASGLAAQFDGATAADAVTLDWSPVFGDPVHATVAIPALVMP